MTTYVNFSPSVAAPFQFQPVLDGTTYYATVLWNLAGQRYYVQLADSNGNVIFLLPLIGSPVAQQIELLSWADGFAMALMPSAHGFKVGRIVDLTIVNAVPVAYNGAVQALVTSEVSFQYQLATDPGSPATSPGSADYTINLAAGYFSASTLIYRTANQQFEINP